MAEQRAEVIARARDAGVGIMVTISTRIAERDALIEIAESDPNIFCTIGTHPHNAHEELDITADEIIRLSDHPKIIGIGEAGLDYFYDNSPRAAQAEGFLNHIEAARQSGLPLIIHSRDADQDMANILETEMLKGAFKFVLHCFHRRTGAGKTGVGDWRLYLFFRRRDVQKRTTAAGNLQGCSVRPLFG